MAKILGVGIATLDIINYVETFPEEDSEVRASRQVVRHGGNISNSLTVLTQFRHQCHFAGVLSEDPDGKRIQAGLRRRGIDLGFARILGHGHAPTSYITLNRSNGSRTIVHYRDLPEYDLSPFLAVDPSEFDWLHFEGRNCDETAAMMAIARHAVVDQPISLEIEKEREDLDQLLPFADIIFFSRAFALGRGFDEPSRFLDFAHDWAPHAVLVLPWGAAGAYMRLGEETHHAASRPVTEVVDTVGAGDTLIAGFIHARVSGRGWLEALYQGVRLAEHKIAQEGFDHLGPADQTPREEILCHLDDLGTLDAIGVDPQEGVPGTIVVRHDDELHAWKNICPHNGSPLSRERRGYLVLKPDAKGGSPTAELRCNVHDARFDLATGRCTAGPCKGEQLQAVPLKLSGGHICRKDDISPGN